MFKPLRYLRNEYASMTKTMRIVIAGIACLLLTLFIYAISVITSGPLSYDFMHDKSEISKIYICPADSLNDDLTCNKEIVIEIQDIDAFVVELEKLNFHKHLLGDPPELHEYSILIEYVNGDRQYFNNWVHSCVQDGKRKGPEVINCEIPEYDAFIQKFIELAEGEY